MSVKSSGSMGSKTGGRKRRGCRSPTGTSSIISYKWWYFRILYLFMYLDRKPLVFKNYKSCFVINIVYFNVTIDLTIKFSSY